MALYLYVRLFGSSFGTVLPMRIVIMSLQLALLTLAEGPFAACVLRDASGSCALLPPAAIVLLLLAFPLSSSPPSARAVPKLHEDIQREQGAHERIRHVYRLADAQVHRNAAERVGLLAGKAARFEVSDHV